MNLGSQDTRASMFKPTFPGKGLTRPVVILAPADWSDPAESIHQVHSLEELLEAKAGLDNPVALIHFDAIASENRKKIEQILDKGAGRGPGLIAPRKSFPTAIRVAKHYGLGVVIPEDSWREAEDRLLWPQWLGSSTKPDPMGEYFGPDDTSKTLEVRDSRDRDRVLDTLSGLHQGVDRAIVDIQDSQLLIDEMLNNAIFHGFVHAQGAENHVGRKSKELNKN